VKNYNKSVKLLRIFSISITALIITFSSNALAIGFSDATFPELATSGRALAMGNAFISRVDDSSAVFYNPAGLGSVRYGHFHFSNFHLETNRGWMNIGTGGGLFDASSSFGKSISLDGQRELLNQPGSFGKMAYTRFHMLPNFTTRYFSAGYLFSKQTLATIQSATSDFEYAQRTDHGPYAAFNLSLLGGVFKVGFTGALIRRKEAVGTKDKDVTLELGDNDTNKGTAFIITGGTKLTFPVTFLPTFAATIHNLGSQKFSHSGGLTRPTKIRQTFDLGFSLTPQIGKTTRLHLEVNYKDFADKYGTSSSRRITFGSEFDFNRTFFVRFGWGDGFGSGGLGLRTRRLEFDLTTYAVDTSGSSFRGIEDRRFSMTLSSGF
jgi:hypothetical protein